MRQDFLLEDVTAVRVADGRVHLKLLLRDAQSHHSQSVERDIPLSLVVPPQSLLRLREQLRCAQTQLDDDLNQAPAFETELPDVLERGNRADWLMNWVGGDIEPGAPSDGLAATLNALGLTPDTVRLSFRYGRESEAIELFATAADDDEADFRRLVLIPRARCLGLIETLGERLSGVRLTGPRYTVPDDFLETQQRQAMTRVDSAPRTIAQADECVPYVATRCRVVEADNEGFSVILSARIGALLVLPMSRDDAHAFLGILFEMAVRARWNVPLLPWLSSLRRTHLRLVPGGAPL